MKTQMACTVYHIQCTCTCIHAESCILFYQYLGYSSTVLYVNVHVHMYTFLQLVPTDGVIQKHAHLRIGRYHQHLKDHLDLGLSALKYMMKCYPEEKEEEDMRRALGMYGLTGKQQVCIYMYTCTCVCVLWEVNDALYLHVLPDTM